MRPTVANTAIPKKTPIMIWEMSASGSSVRLANKTLKANSEIFPSENAIVRSLVRQSLSGEEGKQQLDFAGSFRRDSNRSKDFKGARSLHADHCFPTNISSGHPKPCVSMMQAHTEVALTDDGPTMCKEMICFMQARSECHLRLPSRDENHTTNMDNL